VQVINHFASVLDFATFDLGHGLEDEARPGSPCVRALRGTGGENVRLNKYLVFHPPRQIKLLFLVSIIIPLNNL
jgi:hypothetical protein